MVHAEEQIEQPVAPEIAPQADSTPIKKQHGGRRPGAGRKPNYAKRLLSGVKPMTAAEALERTVSIVRCWIGRATGVAVHGQEAPL